MGAKKPVTLEEVWQLFKETDDKFKETDAKFKESAAEFKEVRKLIAANAKHIGGLSNKWGDMGEALTIGETLPIFNAIDGIEVHSLHNNVHGSCDGRDWEIDGLAVGKGMVIVLEAKTTLKKGHVTTFINKKLSQFTKFEPAYVGYKVYGAIGFLNASSEAKAFAHAKGLLLIRPTQTSKELIALPKGFKLRNFHP